MKHLLPAALLLASAVPAQNHLLLPASANPATELPGYGLEPFMQANSRVQMFFDATECGSASFLADQLELRYDGPLPRVGAPGPFQIQRLQIKVGATTVAQPAALFGANLSQPLTTVFDGPWTYMPDPGTAFPHPWGGPNGALTFPFTTPIGVVVPPGGYLVIELVMQGNNIANFGFAHAILDGAPTSGGPVDGTAQNYGQGCSTGPGQPAATIGTTGTHAPGAAFFVNGQNLGANAGVFAMFGFSDTQSPLGPLPLQLPGTSCAFLQSYDAYLLLVADATGMLPADAQNAALAIPARPVFQGTELLAQLMSVVPNANQWGFVLSDARRITLGNWSAAGRGTWTVSHGAFADAVVADSVRAFGYAVRLRTL